MTNGPHRPKTILHITTRSAWAQAQGAGSYEPPSLRQEGFIHFSDPDQVVAVANARFAGGTDLVLLRVRTDRLTAPVKYESSDRGEERFPHLYGSLNLDAVVDVVPLSEKGSGFELPPEPGR